MATGGEDKVAYSLVKDRTLTLENATKQPVYVYVVVCQDKILVLNDFECRVKIYQLHDGKLLATSDKLEFVPRNMCLIDPMTICVIHKDGLIKMMSIDSTDMLCVIKTTMNLHRQGVLDEYYGVVRFKDYLVVTGVKQQTMCWCIMTLDDQHRYTIQKICKGDERSFVTTKDDSIYIACHAGDEYPHNGVYEFNILNPSKCKNTYIHERLPLPRSIVANEDGNIFVCNEVPDSCIHQLTASCQPVAIFTRDIPWRPFAIFWDNGHLYVPCYESNDITVFRHEYQGSHIAPEVLVSDERRHPVIEETAIQIEERNEKNYPVEQIYSRISDPTAPEKSKLLLPPGKKYHVFFSYASPDIQWVRETVERLENDHGFVCREYDRDNTPGTQLLAFAADSIKYSIKTVVVMTKEAFKSGFVKHEIQMALQQGFETGSKCVVPVLVQNCTIPDYLRILNYVDARDPTQRDIWWPKLLKELQTQAGNDNAPEVIWSDQRNQHLCDETSTQQEQGDDEAGPGRM